MSELVIRHNDKLTRVGPFRLSACGLEVDGKPSFEEWEAAGRFLQRAAGSVQWWVGDWLNYGEGKWGEMYSQAIEQTGMAYDTVAQYKRVANAFTFGRRLPNLTFAHHQEVAYLPPKEADRILKIAEAEGWSTRQVRMEARQAKVAIANGVVSEECCTASDLDALAARGMQFGAIYADPPWQYGNQGTRAATDNHYDTMTVDELCEMPIGKLAAPQSHLWLWTTNGFLFDCPRIFEAWGFEFKSSYVWVKPQIGIGNYLRNSHEFLLLAVRGGLTCDPTARDVRSWGEFDRAEHSAKPERIRKDVVERVSPGPRLELFGRSIVPGWVVWGNQVSRSVFDRDVEHIGDTNQFGQEAEESGDLFGVPTV